MKILKKLFGKHHAYITFGVVVVIWQLLSTQYSPIILPSPLLVIIAFGRIIQSENFSSNLGVTLFRGLSGYFLGLLIGVSLGVIMGKVKSVYNYIYPIITVLQAIPRISWILLAMVWLPLNSTVVIFIILITILPTITINTFEGMGTISKEFLEMGTIYKVSKRYIIMDIFLPSIYPFILSAAKISAGLTWKSILMAELLTVNSGLGFGMAYSRVALATDEIIAYTMIILIIAFLHRRLINTLSIRNHTAKSGNHF